MLSVTWWIPGSQRTKPPTYIYIPMVEFYIRMCVCTGRSPGSRATEHAPSFITETFRFVFFCFVLFFSSYSRLFHIYIYIYYIFVCICFGRVGWYIYCFLVVRFLWRAVPATVCTYSPFVAYIIHERRKRLNKNISLLITILILFCCCCFFVQNVPANTAGGRADDTRLNVGLLAY